MADYTQTERRLRVYTKLGPDVLLLAGFNGLEAVSQPYSFQLDLLSTRSDIDPAKILRTEILVELDIDAQETRCIHGVVSRFAQLGMQDDLAFYRAEVVPWLWFLTLSRESRIYQELSVPDIVEQVFKRLGYSDFEYRLTRSYSPRLFCVQYRETHFAFVTRLLEEEGIFYYFEHSAEKHLLVLTDDSSSSAPVPGPETIRFSTEEHTDEDVISALEREHRVYPGRMTLWEYDYLKPTTDLSVKQGEQAEEVYDFPGGYREHDDGDRLARLLLEAEEAQRQVVRGGGNASGLTPGFHFKLADHFQKSANGKYLVTQVQHLAHGGSFRAWADTEFRYQNDFLAIPHATPFRPRRQTPRPVIHGSQSALVVGPPGEEVYVDKHGRIKVHFYWDRDSKRDEKSSCWIRVATPWGGKGWGSVSVPRIGNEVIVAFEEGDPDRPIVIGSVYNADQTPPFALPDAGIQMGMKTRSSKGGGGMNEITLTDTKGKELINIHAQYDMVTVVQHDLKETVVNGNRTVTVQTGTNTVTIKGDDSHTVQAGDRKVNVTGNIMRKASADIQDHADGAMKLTGNGGGVLITGNAAGVTINGKGGPGIKADGEPNVEIHGAAQVKVDSPVVDIGNAEIKIHGTKVELSAGGGSITIDSSGVTIKGSKVTVKGGPIALN